MLIVIAACLILVALTTLIHFETLSYLSAHLKSIAVPNRSKLLIVILAMFAAHAVEIAVYAWAIDVLISHFGLGTLEGSSDVSFITCFYFSAESYTSLGADHDPTGPIQLIAGVEALNGLLLIAWSASFAYLSMERYWARG